LLEKLNSILDNEEQPATYSIAHPSKSLSRPLVIDLTEITSDRGIGLSAVQNVQATRFLSPSSTNGCVLYFA